MGGELLAYPIALTPKRIGARARVEAWFRDVAGVSDAPSRDVITTRIEGGANPSTTARLRTALGGGPFADAAPGEISASEVTVVVGRDLVGKGR